MESPWRLRRGCIDSATSYWHNSAMPDEPRYSLTELADLAGVTPRTIRYYLSNGLLPSAGQSGPGVKYGDDYLDRLRLIRRLQRDHLPLSEIRRRLDDLDEAQIRDLVRNEPERPPSETALEYVRSILRPTVAAPAALASAPAVLASASAPPAASPPMLRQLETRPDAVPIGLDSLRWILHARPARSLPVGTHRDRPRYRTPCPSSVDAGPEQAGRSPDRDRPGTP